MAELTIALTFWRIILIQEEKLQIQSRETTEMKQRETEKHIEGMFPRENSTGAPIFHADFLLQVQGTVAMEIIVGFLTMGLLLQGEALRESRKTTCIVDMTTIIKVAQQRG